MFLQLVHCQISQESETPMAPTINGIFVQFRPHIDSLTARILLRREGEKKYPGVRNAENLYWGTGTLPPDKGKTWRDYFREGKILLGVGGSNLDEHASPEFGDRKLEGQSATSLVAKDLGIEKHPLYRRLIAEVTKADLNITGILDIGSRLKSLYRMYPDDPERCIAWAEDAILSIIADQQAIMDAQRELKANGHGREVSNRQGDTFWVVGIHSDNPQMAYASRGPSERIAVLIQRRSSGHILILSNQKFAVQMHRVAGAIRYNELVDGGFKAEAARYKHVLEKHGQIELVPNWCYQMPGEALLNGTETVVDLQPTVLSDEQLMNIVCEYISFGSPLTEEETPAE
jgi:hypothetical protein